MKFTTDEDYEESEEESKNPLSPKRNTIFKNYLSTQTTQIIDKTKIESSTQSLISSKTSLSNERLQLRRNMTKVLQETKEWEILLHK